MHGECEFSVEARRRIAGRLERLYPGHDTERLLRRIGMVIGRYGVGRHPSTLPPSRWSEHDAVVIVYGDSIRKEGEPPLRTLRAFAATHLKGAVSTLHILPFFPFSSDDGFSVIDYRKVREDLGDWKDVRSAGEQFGLMFDLVINHVSRRSEWFKFFMMDVAPYRDYFIEVDPKTDLSMVVRPRDLPLLSEVTREGRRMLLWTTFSRDQIDVNFANPDVLFDYLDILFYYIAQGARVVRLDAIAYLWKKVGTPCIHLPETHEIVKLVRDLVDVVAPQVILLTETNVPHAENISYFGHGDEAHMVYQFSLPPLLLHALLNGTSRHLRTWASSLAPPPKDCTYFNFTASHDGIGVRPLEGLVPEAEVKALLDGVTARGGHVSYKRNTDGSTSAYELNITYYAALGPERGGHDDLHVERFLCSQVIMLGMQGIPGLYIHALTASPNDEEGVRQSGRPRSINRRSWPLDELEGLLANQRSETARVFSRLTDILKIRASHRAFHPGAVQQVLPSGDDCFMFLRGERGQGRILAMHNMTAQTIRVPVPEEAGVTGRTLVDLLAWDAETEVSGGVLMAPYQSRWLIVA